jgi:hypothetical protein
MLVPDPRTLEDAGLQTQSGRIDAGFFNNCFPTYYSVLSNKILDLG